MEENKNIPTTEGEAIAPEAPVTDIPGTDAPSPDLILEGYLSYLRTHKE